jgi:RHS repeat-associated protein
VIQTTYDANGNVASITPPSRPAHSFDYTPIDLESSYTPPDLGIGTVATTYTYNADRQLTQITRPDGQGVTMSYEPTTGRLSTLTEPRGVTTFTYTPTTGQVASITVPDGGTLSYTYDGSLLTGSTWTGPIAGSVTRTYDTDFRVATESINGGNSVTFTYDPDSLLTGAGALTLARHAQHCLLTGTTLGNVTDTYTYSPFGELATYQANSSGSPLLDIQYTRDALGRITQKVETIGGTTTTTVYGYDTAGRLTDVTVDGTLTAHYDYDNNGNRLGVTRPGTGTVSGTYDAQDRLTTYGAVTYSYSANGDLLTATSGSDTTTYSYDVFGNLTAVTLPNGTQIEYVIDGQNRRIGKKVNGTLARGFLYGNQLRPIAEVDGTGTVIGRFVYGTKINVPEYMIKGATTYRLLTDRLGSVRLVVDTAAGTIAQRLDYDEFGQVILDTNPEFQPFGFAGGIYDPDTKLTRFGERDYDAFTGRWATKDPIGFAEGTNFYVYVGSAPTNLIDPLGLAGNYPPPPPNVPGGPWTWQPDPTNERGGTYRDPQGNIGSFDPEGHWDVKGPGPTGQPGGGETKRYDPRGNPIMKEQAHNPPRKGMGPIDYTKRTKGPRARIRGLGRGLNSWCSLLSILLEAIEYAGEQQECNYPRCI